MFQKFEDIVNHVVLDAKSIIETLSIDLLAIDMSLISKDFGLVSKIVDEEKFFFELAVLCRDKTYAHPEWGLLSGRVKMLYIKRKAPKTFHESCEMLKNTLDPLYYNFCMLHSEKLEDILSYFKDQGYDWSFDIFAVETLLRGYLLKVKNLGGGFDLAEIPQYLYLRVATFLWFPKDLSENSLILSIENIKQTYNDLASGKISAPSPLQFNAGAKKPQLASCFLMAVEDNMGSLCRNWKHDAIISMLNGGIGISFDSIRHSEIGNFGWSNGVVPWIKIVNEILATVNQGGKRKGSGAMYTCIWHIDIFEFVDLRDPSGKEEFRARDLFYGLMISDIFMERVAKDEMWSTFCPAKTNNLERYYGEEFEKRYLELERRGINGEFPHAFRQINARELWLYIIRSQIKTGMPYIVYKDAVNRKTNQQNLGTIRSSNLCTEIMEYTDADNIASCNLSSIPVSVFVKSNEDGIMYFDFEELGQVTRRTVRNLGQVINRTYYPEEIPEIKTTNMDNKPIGIGIQDLAGCFALLDLCWDSIEANELSEKISRVMYYHGMDENIQMANEFGSYKNFPGSPASKGLFQFDLWAIEKLMKEGKPIPNNGWTIPSTDFDWKTLREKMMRYGLYFGMLFAQMPTASSAQIRGNNESIEPYTQLMFARTVLSGQFVICVPHLVKDLEDIGLWNDKMLKHLFSHQGSIKDFPEDDLEPDIAFRLNYLKLKYKTAFELKQKVIADLYLKRAKYQCQSSSNNVFIKNPTASIVSAYHFYMWRGGAKTGMYYLRQNAGSEPLNFSLDNIHASAKKKPITKTKEKICLSCHS